MQQEAFVYVGNVLLSRAVTRQVSSTLKSLTSVFGMGTGVPSLPSSPTLCITLSVIHSKLNNIFRIFRHSFLSSFTSILSWSSPRLISTALLNMLPHLHTLPIYHVVFVESYYLSVWEILSLGGLHA